MWQYNYFYNSELYHYGVKGMKWGVRRFEDDASRKRYTVDVARAKRDVFLAKKNERRAVNIYNKETFGGYIVNDKATAKLQKATGRTKFAKRQLRSEKVKEKLNFENGSKSRHRQKLEQQYREKGMSDDEAEIAAYKREKTEKIIAVTAGITIAAATAYVAYKHYDKTVDRFIQTGVKLQNISNNSNKCISDAFYVSMTKGDNTKYRGLYGSTINAKGEKVYETTLKVKNTMKLASEKSATKALSALVKEDPNYAQTLRKHLESSIGRNGTGKQAKTIQNGLNSLKKGRIDAKVYNALNLSLVDHDLSTSSQINSGFYGKLKSLGYDVIMDVNDKRLSGYHSAKPMIAFNTSSKLVTDKVREVGLDEIQKAARKGLLDISVKTLLPSAVGIAGSAGLVAAGYRALDNRNNDLIVREYKRQHPDSNLSYDQILVNYYGA